jgi:Caspase domain
MKVLHFFLLPFLSAPVIGQVLIEKTNPVTVDYSQRQIVAKKADEIPKHDRKFRALIMGVSKYEFESPGLPSLDQPVIDAQRVYDSLIKHYTFEAEDVILLKDPTRQQIIDAFEKLSNETSEKDNVLVFYAGHGVWDKQKDLGYWLPSDASLDSKSHWIANSQIKDYFSSNVIRSKHTLLITDACFGGSIFKTRSVSSETLVRIAEMYRETSRTAMTSGNLSTVPDKSIFIQQFVKKLVDNTDDYLPARQLFTRIYEPIVNNSSTNPLYGVIQGAGDEGGDFIFIRRESK